MLIDRFLASAIEVDVDAIRDHTGEVLIGGVMEHVEEAGVHSGDSACAIPPQTLPDWVVEVITSYTTAIANRLDVRGLINVQYAVLNQAVFVIEANPRASRTVPFVAKAKGVPLAKVATRVMLGSTLAELRAEGLLVEPVTGHVAVKEAVLPFTRFPEVDPALGPEMRSTGEVMGIDSTFGRAFFKAELSAGNGLPQRGTVFLSLNDNDKPAGLVVARRMRERGLGLVATKGTAEYLASFGVAGRSGARQGPGRRRRPHRGRPDRRRRDRVRRQHATRLDGTHRRRAHPQGGQPPPGRLRDDGQRRPRRRPRTRRVARATAGEKPAGVPPTRTTSVSDT